VRGIKCELMDYTFTFPPELKEARGPVVLQLPSGLKRAAAELVQCLRAYGIDPIVEVDPTYGSCDIHAPQLREALGSNVTIVHVGHTPYPPELARGASAEGVKVVYAEASFNIPPRSEVIRGAAGILLSRGLKRVSVLTTVQHAKFYEAVVRGLEEAGLSVIRAGKALPYLLEGQVLGCDYRVVPRLAEGYVMLGGGLFHAIGLYLATQRPVVQVDPYRQEARDMTREGERFLAMRLKKVSDAINARRWGVIMGLKTGQYRPWVLNALQASLRHHDREFILLASDVLNQQYLRDVDSEWFEAFVVTSCPRLPVDDLYEYEKPVLTPGEAFMALQGRLEPYMFPW